MEKGCRQLNLMAQTPERLTATSSQSGLHLAMFDFFQRSLTRRTSTLCIVLVTAKDRLPVKAHDVALLWCCGVVVGHLEVASADVATLNTGNNVTSSRHRCRAAMHQIRCSESFRFVVDNFHVQKGADGRPERHLGPR